MLTLHIEAPNMDALRKIVEETIGKPDYHINIEPTVIREVPAPTMGTGVALPVIEKKSPGRPKKDAALPSASTPAATEKSVASGASSTPAVPPPGNGTAVVEAIQPPELKLANLENMRTLLRQIVALHPNTDEGLKKVGAMIKDLTGKEKASDVGVEQYGLVMDAAQKFIDGQQKK
jgi:hypothetical protein